MKVLVACEESQEVCKAFRAKGHEAYSCDIQECSGGHPEWHIRDDCIPLLNGNCAFITEGGQWVYIDGKWDLLIAHPPCTYLSNAGANSLFKKIDGKTWMNYERYKKGLDGKAFFMKCLNADCEKIAVENPIPSSVYELPRYTQTIQPYHFGHPWSKKTCLWLKGLTPLIPTEIVFDYKPYVSSGMYSKTKDPKYKGFSRAGGAQKIRAKTFPGIAKAMADQWG